MAEQKKMVEAITSMDVDFAKWYTDVVRKADLADYSSVKGCTIIRPYGCATVSYTHLHGRGDTRRPIGGQPVGERPAGPPPFHAAVQLF